MAITMVVGKGKAKMAPVAVIMLLVVTTPWRAEGMRMVGGRTKVKDVRTNVEVQELGRYSVEQYNLRQQQQQQLGPSGSDSNSGELLRFEEVMEAETQVVSGLKYFLKVAATSTRSALPQTFNAVVLVKPWAHTKQLLHFSPNQLPISTK
ncbi:hypothetical protein NMG60_11031712 [Bertholletia excelsa]